MKKILFVCDPGLDYGEFMLFNGLCNLFGEQNIVTYPFKASYYGMTDHDYKLENTYTTGSKGFTKPEENMVARFPNYWNVEKLKENFDVFDLVILADCRILAVEALREIKKAVGGFSIPTIVHESEDYEDIRVDTVKEFNPILYFKRTLRKDGKNQFMNRCPIPILPCPFSAILNSAPYINTTKKLYDVWYVNGDTHPLRATVYKKMMEKNYPNMVCNIIAHQWPTTWYNKISFEQYMTTIAKSKIAVAPRGWSDDSLKRMEIPIYDTLLFSTEIGYVTPNDFEDQKSYVKFSPDMTDFESKLEYYMKEENETQKIAKEGQKRLHQYHTTEIRAGELMKLVEKYR